MLYKRAVTVLAILFVPLFMMSNTHTLSHHFSLKEIDRGDHPVTVPLGGNTWRSVEGGQGGRITNGGIADWSDKDISFTTYVRASRTGTLKVWLHLKVPEGQSSLQIEINGKGREVKAAGSETKDYYAGSWNITDTGYIAIHLKGLTRSGDIFADISSLKLGGSCINDRTAYVKNNDGDFFYWGRRGPSVHLNYQVPDEVNAAWFYTEITVPEGNDVTGSYFEADGFGQGYFGMQVNSPATRHILFSVWSPYNTQDPDEVPDSLKIQLIKKGAGVHAGAFGGEGSGGQSYMNYGWKAGITYKFLLHCQPGDNDHTVFTAYFYAPEKGKWYLIAGFSRPKTHTYLKGLYSFLENFSPGQGDITRMALYGNQWICTDKGQWIELNKIKFTTDNTGNKGYRMDYAGGVKGNDFYLKNCGFFSNYTRNGTRFKRPVSGRPPEIDFQKLP